MKLKCTFCVLVIALGGFAMAQSTAQQDEENVRGAFLTSRPKEKPQSSPNSKPIRRPPKSAGSTTAVNPNSSASVTVTAGGTSGTARISVQPIGLGVTLFTKDTNGLAVRVDPSHEFRKGDNVRILLETNTDGFLYIFNTTDGGPPVMIYPGAEIDEGGNYIQSHVPFEIPSSGAAQERLRWFRFDQYPGTERLYFVFTRAPLAGVPIEDDLISYCRESKTPCPWKPGPELWAQLQKEMAVPLKVDKSQKYGRAQTTSEQNATTRGIGLSQEDPEPSVIMMAVSTGTNSLVTSIDLIHK